MSKIEYDVSIISPVYNAEEYIEEMMQSIIKQTHDFNKIQLIMVNDGSPDNSKDIVEEYSKKYPNIVLINQKNGGVSKARNTGIKASTGKYIMLVDPDDYLSPGSVHALYEFMEENPDLDVCTYKMINLWPSGKTTDHFRMKLFDKGTAVYDLKEYPYNSQTCVNIFFRNRFEKNNFYDESMAYAEDEKYNTMLILEKEKLGFVKEAIYYYRRHGNGQASEDKLNPLYSLDGVLDNYESNFKRSIELHGYVSKYVQCLFLNAIRWRIISDALLPYYQEEKEFNKTTERINKLIKQLDIKTLFENPTFDKYHKFHLANIIGIKPKIELKKDRFIISYEGEVLEEAKRIALRVNRFRILNNELTIVGYIRSILLNYKDPKLLLKIKYNDGNEKIEPVETKDSVFSAYKSKMRTSNIYRFDLKIKLDNVSEIKFITDIEGHEYNCNYEFGITTPFYKKLRLKSYKTDKLDVLFNNYGFEFKKKSIFNNIIFNLVRLGYITFKNPKALYYRKAAKKYKNDRIWLYCDRKGVMDNGYYQFKHDVKINDGIKKIYIVDDDIENVKEYFTEEELKNNVIKKGSSKDFIYHLAAEYLFSSFSTFYECNPYSGRDSKLYNDLIKYKLIYLQHGILYAHLPKMYSKELCEVYNIIISSEFEKKNLVENYSYNEDDLVMTGMPRFQEKEEKVEKKNKILYAPSWRSYLIVDAPINGERELKEDAFLKSKYYQEINKLINDKELNEALKKNKTILDIKMHPIFNGYIKFLQTDLSNIHIVEGSVNEKEYSLFITDFSSYQFDFARMNTPMVYFLPDEIEFKAGLHSYRELDLKLEDAFGDIAKTSEELKDLIIESMKKGFKQPKKYSDRCKNFFVKENDPQGKIYQTYKEGK